MDIMGINSTDGNHSSDSADGKRELSHCRVQYVPE